MQQPELIRRSKCVWGRGKIRRAVNMIPADRAMAAPLSLFGGYRGDFLQNKPNFLMRLVISGCEGGRANST
jgi:hypothetical protein